MKKFEEKVEMVVLTVLLLGLGVCIGTAITEMIMFTEYLGFLFCIEIRDKNTPFYEEKN